MPEITLRCPACKVLLKLKKMPVGKTAMPCPKCGTKVPLPREEEAEETVPEVEAVDEEVEEEAEPATARSRRRREEEEDEEDEGGEEEQPRRRKKKKKKAPADRIHLWPILGGACLGGVLVVFLFFFLVLGTKGFPNPEDAPVFVKYVVLFLFVAVGVGISINGINGIITQRITVANRAWFVIVETEHTGSQAVLTGAGQCIAGAIMTGAGLYGLIFHG
jgi:DNA-directed RNA polymerase subunit M/transcription elongation factor TFIIS